MLMIKNTLRAEFLSYKASLCLSTLPCPGHSRRLQQRAAKWEMEGWREDHMEGWGQRAGEGGPQGPGGILEGGEA